MQPINAIFYDTEIVKCIPQKDTPNELGLDYCRGWGDHAGMLISCICAYDFSTDRFRVFLQDNLPEFQSLVKEREHILGFNSINFDDKLCNANGIEIKTTYDLLAEVRVASGQPPNYVAGLSRRGYSLGELAFENLGYGKSGSGELAPKLFQQGKIGAVVDYCLNDVSLSVSLLRLGLSGKLKDPTNGRTLHLRPVVLTPSATVVDVVDDV